MFQGELFGYPLFLMKTLMLKNEVEYAFSDVMCKLWKFVRRKEPTVSSSIKPALSVMHAKGHALDCQVQCCTPFFIFTFCILNFSEAKAVAPVSSRLLYFKSTINLVHVYIFNVGYVEW